MPNDGKELENLAYLVHKSLSPDAKVTLNERVTGKKTKSSRQLDITIRQRIGLTDLLIVVECKDHSRPIDSPEVGSFISSLQDVGAQKGIMVSRKGFTEGARNLALDAGLDLYGLDDIVEESGIEKVEIPVLVEFVGMSTVQFAMSGSTPFNPADAFNLGEVRTSEIPLYSLDGKLQGTARKVLQREWNKGAISREATPFPARIWNSDDYAIKDPDKDAYYPQSLGAAIWIKKNFFFGSLEMESFKYFRNEISGEMVGKLFKSETFCYPMIEKRWKKIEDPSTLAVKPSLIFSAEDYYHVE